MLRRLGTGWAIYAEAQRIESNSYPNSHWPDPVSRLIDEERKLRFESEKHFESAYFLTLVYLPPTETANKISAAFVESKSNTSINYQQILESFETESHRIEKLLTGVFPEVRRLTDSNLYLLIQQSQKNATLCTLQRFRSI